MWTLLLCLHRMSPLIFIIMNNISNSSCQMKIQQLHLSAAITSICANIFHLFGLALLLYELHWQEFFQTTKMTLWHLTFFVTYNLIPQLPWWNYILIIKKDIKPLTKWKRKESGKVAPQPTPRLKEQMTRNVPEQWGQLAWNGPSAHLYPSKNYYPPNEDGYL